MEPRRQDDAGAGPQGALALETYASTDSVAHVLTNLASLHALSVWRLYNAGAVVEQRIKECY